MAKYTIYAPQVDMGGPNGEERWRTTHTNGVTSSSYFTYLLKLELKKELWSLGHEAEIVYLPLYEKYHRLYIPELGIDVTEESPMSQGLWMIVSNDETKNFCLVDFQDYPGITQTMCQHKLPNFVMSLLGMFSIERYRNTPIDITKIVPFVFTSYYPIWTESFVETIADIRKNTPELDNRILFYGNTRPEYHHDDFPIREVANILKEKYPDEVDIGGWHEKLPLEDFFKKAATYKVALALPGHPWCSREHELWTLGIPVMMYEHTHHMAVDLVPNWHYIAVPGGERRNIGMAKDPEYAADSIMKYHRKWILPEYDWRRNIIARNGQERMRRQVNAISVVPKLVELLQLGNW